MIYSRRKEIRMKELKVGEKAKCVVTIEAVRCGTCEECFFYDGYYHCANENKFECLGKYRSDGEDVIFKLVKK